MDDGSCAGGDMTFPSNREPERPVGALYLIRDTTRQDAIRVVPLRPGIDRFALVSGKYVPEIPLDFRVETGSIACDVIETGLVGVRLISERFVTLLRDNELTGWRLFEVRIQDE